MNTTFTAKQIASLKREARDRKRSSGTQLSMELDSIARKQGFANWSLLMNAAGNEKADPCNGQGKPITGNALLKIVLGYIRELDEYSVRKMCWNGSLWVDKTDVLNGTVTLDSLHTLGNCWDGLNTQYARGIGAVLLTSFEGLADQFVDEDEEDEDGNQLKPARWQTMYSTDAGRTALLETFEASFDGDFDSLMADINNGAEDFD